MEIRNPPAFRRTFLRDLPAAEVRLALEVHDQRARRRAVQEAERARHAARQRAQIEGARAARERAEAERAEAERLLGAFAGLDAEEQEQLRALARGRVGEDAPALGRELLERDALVDVLRERTQEVLSARS